MNLRRLAFRGLNLGLSKVGLKLDLKRQDFDDRPLDDFSRGAMLDALADAFLDWRSGSSTAPGGSDFDAHDAVRHFYDRWLEQPFRDQQGGSRFNNLLWLYLVARHFAPDLVVDSGTYQGASAWALALGAPQAKVFSFDIDLSQTRVRVQTVSYVEQDWATFALPTAPGARLLCYFDDHVDQARRLLEAADRNCALAIFDDDYPVTSFYAMAPSPSVLPKIEFVLDERLHDGQILRWRANGREQSWGVDKRYLDAARATILASERLPNTSLITGIHQTPYRLVALNDRGG